MDEIYVLAAVNEKPTTCVRKLAESCGISNSTIHNILKKHNMMPYKPIKVQKLFDKDFEVRLQFAIWFADKLAEDRTFFRNIFFTNECVFSTNGQICHQNARMGSLENPHWKRPVNHQSRTNILVWCRIFNR
nr:PREDICTED: uncharacterized protein LOC105663864 [Megachile rotundata]